MLDRVKAFFKKAENAKTKIVYKYRRITFKQAFLVFSFWAFRRTVFSFLWVGATLLALHSAYLFTGYAGEKLLDAQDWGTRRIQTVAHAFAEKTHILASVEGEKQELLVELEEAKQQAARVPELEDTLLTMAQQKEIQETERDLASTRISKPAKAAKPIKPVKRPVTPCETINGIRKCDEGYSNADRAAMDTLYTNLN